MAVPTTGGRRRVALTERLLRAVASISHRLSPKVQALQLRRRHDG